MTPEAPRTRLDCVESDANPQGWSDTAQKPDDVDQSVRVARILGWEPRWPHRSPKGGPDGDVLSMQCAECDEWFNPIDRTSFCTVPWNPHWERDGRTHAGTPYDESDLANYLADCGLWVAIGNAYDGEGGMNEWDVTVSSVHGDGHNEPAVDHVEAATAGPTLLAALEAAVLAVAEGRP